MGVKVGLPKLSDPDQYTWNDVYYRVKLTRVWYRPSGTIAKVVKELMSRTGSTRTATMAGPRRALPRRSLDIPTSLVGNREDEAALLAASFCGSRRNAAFASESIPTRSFLPPFASPCERMHIDVPQRASRPLVRKHRGIHLSSVHWTFPIDLDEERSGVPGPSSAEDRVSSQMRTGVPLTSMTVMGSSVGRMRRLGAQALLFRLGVAGANEEAIRPRFEARGVAKLRKVLPDAQQRLLRRVLGKIEVAQDPARHGQVPIRDPGGKVGECPLVSVLSSDHEIGIHCPIRSGGINFDLVPLTRYGDTGKPEPSNQRGNEERRRFRAASRVLAGRLSG